MEFGIEQGLEQMEMVLSGWSKGRKQWADLGMGQAVEQIAVVESG
jgi:hypothetical protein